MTGTHFDYANQAWTVNGLYICCGHPAAMNCCCYGREHAGEPVALNADLPTLDARKHLLVR